MTKALNAGGFPWIGELIYVLSVKRPQRRVADCYQFRRCRNLGLPQLCTDKWKPYVISYSHLKRAGAER